MAASTDITPAPGGKRPAARRYGVASLALWVSLVLIGAGLMLPAITVSSMWVYEETYSILGGILSLIEGGDVALGAFVLLVSVAFPIAKCLVGLLVLARLRGPNPRVAKLAGVLSAVSRWSMADVMVLALMVLVVNGQLLSSADIHSGVALFAAGVVLSAMALLGVERRARGS